MSAAHDLPQGQDLAAWLAEVSADSALPRDFEALCGFGGRLTGTPGEAAAHAWALERLRAIGSDVTQLKVPYDGWTCHAHRLELLGEPGTKTSELRCHALLRSASTPEGGLEGEVLDLGQGRPEDFARLDGKLTGRIALVRHEYPFSPTHVHRRRKYDMAVRAGAIGFLIANPLPGGGPLSGSSGRPVDGTGIPAAYIGHDDSVAITRSAPLPRVRLYIDGEEQRHSTALVSVLDVPGGTGKRVVLSAHMDGHPLGTSALDNATGVAVVLAAARAIAPLISQHTHGLRVCFFSAEEWALAGSARYLADMAPAERAALVLNINLDTVAGDDQLTALISDYPALAGFVSDAARLGGVPIGTHLPLMPNSDHANFAAHGIPAMRLVAGFNRPESRVRHILSAEDRSDIVVEAELRQALRATAAMAWQGIHMPAAQLEALRVRV